MLLDDFDIHFKGPKVPESLSKAPVDAADWKCYLGKGILWGRMGLGLYGVHIFYGWGPDLVFLKMVRR